MIHANFVISAFQRCALCDKDRKTESFHVRLLVVLSENLGFVIVTPLFLKKGGGPWKFRSFAFQGYGFV